MDAARRLAGEVVITGIPGPQLDSATRRALTDLGPSGVILFRRNVENVDQLRQLTAALHDLPSRPLVAIDHEGGRVMRLSEPFTHFPPARDIGRGGDPAAAEAVGRAMAVELRSVGIDLDFAPVLDVDSNPRNPVIGDRAFGRTPDSVSVLAIAFLRGMLAGGVLPCGKHFPGHGDTDRDSHTERPTVARSRAALDATELPPFRAAIAAGVPLLMTAHVLYPALDPDHPATLSPVILRDLLRGELGFSGVVVSDDLEMQAVTDHISVAEAAVASLQAGVDWVLICNDLQRAVDAGARIAAAIDAGELATATVAAAAARIRRLHVPAPVPVSLPVPAHQALNERLQRSASAAV